MPEHLADMLAEAGEKAFAGMSKPRRKDDGNVTDTVRTALRRAAESEWGKRPVCKVVVIRV